MEFETLVLAASTADLADADHPTAREHADAIEFRMDLASEPLAALSAYDAELPIIATNRAAWEGGDAAAPSDPEGLATARLDALRSAVEHDAVGAIDVEVETFRRDPAAGRALREHAHDNDAAVIASVHDFEATPSRELLREYAEEATARGDVGKLATTATDRGETLDLLAVTHEFAAAGERVATMAMGEAGRHTRAVAPLYGSRIGYAPVDPAAATAPGQYDLATLAETVARLE